mmetsp:Transcript_39217/g.110863  ORF Transcript_39217/g.110863 Transcript_39217/m.110863 type:complete len:234 (-) Transcript_39217:1-702(-)
MHWARHFFSTVRVLVAVEHVALAGRSLGVHVVAVQVAAAEPRHGAAVDWRRGREQLQYLLHLPRTIERDVEGVDVRHSQVRVGHGHPPPGRPVDHRCYGHHAVARRGLERRSCLVDILEHPVAEGQRQPVDLVAGALGGEERVSRKLLAVQLRETLRAGAKVVLLQADDVGAQAREGVAGRGVALPPREPAKRLADARARRQDIELDDAQPGARHVAPGGRHPVLALEPLCIS